MITASATERLIAATASITVTLLAMVSMDAIAGSIYLRAARHELTATHGARRATGPTNIASGEKAASAPCMPWRRPGG